LKLLGINRYRWWIFLSTALIGSLIGLVVMMSIMTPRAEDVRSAIRYGMTYGQVNDVMHNFGWTLQYTRQEAEYSTWHGPHGGTIG
jgi:hypothetical protein